MPEGQSRTLGGLLKSVREAKNLSQKAVAERLIVSASAVGTYERGEQIPDVKFLAGFSAMFGVSFAKLLSLALTSFGIQATAAMGRLRRELSDPAGLGEDAATFEAPHVNESETIINEPEELPETQEDGGSVTGDIFDELDRMAGRPDHQRQALQALRFINRNASQGERRPRPRREGGR